MSKIFTPYGSITGKTAFAINGGSIEVHCKHTKSMQRLKKWVATNKTITVVKEELNKPWAELNCKIITTRKSKQTLEVSYN